jgi:hypothetical protein
MIEMKDSVLEYYSGNRDESKAEYAETFGQIMDLVRYSLTAEQQEELIKLYVHATHHAFWEGWYEHGFQTTKTREEARA